MASQFAILLARLQALACRYLPLCCHCQDCPCTSPIKLFHEWSPPTRRLLLTFWKFPEILAHAHAEHTRPSPSEGLGTRLPGYKLQFWQPLPREPRYSLKRVLLYIPMIMSPFRSYSAYTVSNKLRPTKPGDTDHPSWNVLLSMDVFTMFPIPVTQSLIHMV